MWQIIKKLKVQSIDASSIKNLNDELIYDNIPT